ncbi:MAG: hypothetical protein OXQ32_08675 [bacterium]|nr:hypothetical protein [bacterium]MDE2875396.1 hypothetical protein [Gemmatimonadota bacterium]
MRPTEDFPGFDPAVDPQEQVDRAIALLGRRPDLQGRLRINPDPARKRQAGGWSVFGFRGSAGEFNESPHLLLHVADNAVCARVILPNKARGGLWTRLRRARLAHLMSPVLREMTPAMANCPGMEPRLILKQRHWRTRSGPSFQDAYLDFDLRTLRGHPDSGVKRQPEWVEAAQHVVANKASNLELQVGATFPYDHCPAIRTVDALDHVASAWIGCRPFIEWLRVG